MSDATENDPSIRLFFEIKTFLVLHIDERVFRLIFNKFSLWEPEKVLLYLAYYIYGAIDVQSTNMSTPHKSARRGNENHVKKDKLILVMSST
jgi:hypothetical protein